MKPNESLANDAADRFRTTHWIEVLLTAQVHGFRPAFRQSLLVT
jgi:hypothetical protein